MALPIATTEFVLPKCDIFHHYQGPPEPKSKSRRGKPAPVVIDRPFGTHSIHVGGIARKPTAVLSHTSTANIQIQEAPVISS